VIIQQQLLKTPDIITIIDSREKSEIPLIAVSNHGDWFFSDNNILSYIGEEIIFIKVVTDKLLPQVSHIF